MKKNFFQNFIAKVFSIILISFIMLQLSCSKSADDLYIEGKTLIQKEETFEEGLNNLILFEKEYPQESRAPEVVLTIASLFQNQKNYDEAIEAYKRLIKSYPHSQEAYKGKFLLGYMYYEELNDTKNATEIFNEFIKAYPDSELTISAKILLENINIPIEEWSIVKELELIQKKESNSQTFETDD